MLRTILQYTVIAPLKIMAFLLAIVPVAFIMFADEKVADGILEAIMDFTILEK